ncbi:thermostable hemolysin [Micromonospora narathiwatensis]|uniref:Thermostable hemolysin n=1 Tax=Micromonospora narathiwatensis TaxID=299146 RepID=A0A1A8ZHH4_9ACTN|nr:thermostable hemolysin [Micromonospora narathiwatensis]SBT43292.1 Thermostable hemolysin [Micromonospora narathiwatensis]
MTITRSATALGGPAATIGAEALRVRVATPPSPEWDAAAAFVRTGYAEIYNALIDPAPDRFVVATRQRSGRPEEIVACGGMTFHSHQGFFSERYLDQPLEEVLRRVAGAPVSRDDVVEVGSFVAVGGSGAELIRLLPLIAWCQGMRFALCTATAPLAAALPQFGVPFVSLGRARPTWMSAGERLRWGTYYDQAPTTGLVPLDRIGDLVRACTGRYRFDNLDVALRRDLPGETVTDAH